jgi:hypothetical protein
MKTAWMAMLLLAAAGASQAGTPAASTTIYKYVDESGRVTYSNKPMKGATVVELEPLTTIVTPPAVLAAKSNFTISNDRGTPPASERPAQVEKASYTVDKPRAAIATVTPIGPTAMVTPDTQRSRDNDRRRILEDELAREQQSLERTRAAILEEQQNPQLVAAVRAAQAVSEPTPSQLAQMRDTLDKVSGRIRGLQATASDQEKNVDALKRELASIKS